MRNWVSYLLAMMLLALGIAVFGAFITPEGSEAATEPVPATPGPDETIAWGDLPPVVEKALKAALEGAEADRVVRHSESGFTYYSAEFKRGEVAHEVKVADDGVLLSSKAAVAVTDLPPAIAEQIHLRFPNASAQSARKVVWSFYEVTLNVNDVPRDLRIFGNGQIIEGGVI